MSALHTSRLIAAFKHPSSATPQARALIADLPKEHIPKIMDVLIDTASVHRKPSKLVWSGGTALAGSIAAIAGAFGLFRMLQILPVSAGWAALPLLGLALVLGGCLSTGRTLRAPSSQTLEALELSLRGAKVPASKAGALARFALGLEEVQASRGSPSRLPSSLLIGAGTAWAVFSFWIIYFVALGQTAVSGAW